MAANDRERAERLKAALRANLRKRKERDRATDVAIAVPETGAQPNTEDSSRS